MIRHTRPRSLMAVLIISMTALAVALFVMMTWLEFLGLDAPTPPPAERTFLDWLNELTPVAVFMVTTTAAIWLTLNLALRPMQRLSERAGAIGPETLHERLAPADAPTELEPLVIAFNQSLDRLESAWAAQRAFSANAAHELRTPLAALRAHVESLLPATERQTATVEFDRLSRLIEQLLLLAEADQDRLTRQARFDLVGLAREVATEMAPRIVAQGRELIFDSEVERLERCGDPVLAGLGLRNLLENAMRHTPPGVRIEVQVTGSGVLSVRDSGPGVPPAFEVRLFERFAKSDANSGGAGLGLSIVARVMTLHGGRAWFERRPVGAAFHLAFPD